MSENKTMMTDIEIADAIKAFMSLKSQDRAISMWRGSVARAVADAIEELYQSGVDAGRDLEKKEIAGERKAMEKTRARYLSQILRLQDIAKRSTWAIESAEQHLQEAKKDAQEIMTTFVLDEEGN